MSSAIYRSSSHSNVKLGQEGVLGKQLFINFYFLTKRSKLKRHTLHIGATRMAPLHALGCFRCTFRAMAPPIDSPNKKLGRLRNSRFSAIKTTTILMTNIYNGQHFTHKIKMKKETQIYTILNSFPLQMWLGLIEEEKGIICNSKSGTTHKCPQNSFFMVPRTSANNSKIYFK